MPKDIVGQHVEDASAESSTATETVTAEPEGEPEGEPKDLSARNVRGELLRKMGDMEAATREQLARIEGMLAARPQPAAQPSGPPDVNTMSVEQLEAMRSQIPQAQMQAFDRLVNDRRVAEQVRGVINSEFSRRETERARSEATREAFTRYPDLNTGTSAIRRMTNKVLEEWGVGENSGPRDVLNAANEAASRLGITPVTRRGQGDAGEMRQPGSRTAPPPGGKATKTLSDDKADAIAKALRGALPAGKTFNKERIQQAHAQYTEHRNLVVK